jgi:hypothetical protein
VVAVAVVLAAVAELVVLVVVYLELLVQLSHLTQRQTQAAVVVVPQSLTTEVMVDRVSLSFAIHQVMP